MLPAKNCTAATTVRLLKSGLFSYFGYPLTITSDRASSFTSNTFKEFCLDLGIKHVHTSPYFPKPSHTERHNKNIGVALRIFHSGKHTEWDNNLHFFTVAYNSAHHESTGTTPAELFLGYPLSIPLENRWNLDELLQVDNTRNLEEKWRRAIQQLHNAREKVRTQYNKGRSPNPYRVGDRVMYKLVNLSNASKNISKKLLPLWSKPCVINRMLSPVTVELVCPKTGKIVRTAHISHLKPYNIFHPN